MRKKKCFSSSRSPPSSVGYKSRWMREEVLDARLVKVINRKICLKMESLWVDNSAKWLHVGGFLVRTWTIDDGRDYADQEWSQIAYKRLFGVVMKPMKVTTNKIDFCEFHKNCLKYLREFLSFCFSSLSHLIKASTKIFHETFKKSFIKILIELKTFYKS